MVRAVEVTISDVGDGRMLLGRFSQIPFDQDNTGVTADVRTLPEGAMPPSPNAVLQPSPSHARMQSHGRRARRARSRATRHRTYRDTWSVHSGDDGADTTAEG